MIFIYSNLKKFIYVVFVLMTTCLSFVSCAKESYFEIADKESRYPVDVEISGFVYDKDTNLPITGKKIEIILEVFKDKAYISPMQVSNVSSDEDDGSFKIEISAMSKYLKLTALGAPDYGNGSIEYYLAPSGMQYDEDYDEYKAENQIIYLGLRQGGRLIPSIL